MNIQTLYSTTDSTYSDLESIVRDLKSEGFSIEKIEVNLMQYVLEKGISIYFSDLHKIINWDY